VDQSTSDASSCAWTPTLRRALKSRECRGHLSAQLSTLSALQPEHLHQPRSLWFAGGRRERNAREEGPGSFCRRSLALSAVTSLVGRNVLLPFCQWRGYTLRRRHPRQPKAGQGRKQKLLHFVHIESTKSKRADTSPRPEEVPLRYIPTSS